jgi:hypothetical protein
MVAFEGLCVPENGDLSPAYAPFVGTLPPATERGRDRYRFAFRSHFSGDCIAATELLK